MLVLGILKLWCRTFRYKWTSVTFKPLANEFTPCWLSISPPGKSHCILQYITPWAYVTEPAQQYIYYHRLYNFLLYLEFSSWTGVSEAWLYKLSLSFLKPGLWHNPNIYLYFKLPTLADTKGQDCWRYLQAWKQCVIAHKHQTSAAFKTEWATEDSVISRL